MGGHHHEEFKIPDWRQYKVENCKELMEVQKSLERQGLKDPWLRNEVWRFDPAIQKYSKLQRFGKGMFRGFPIAVGLVAITIGIEKALGVDYHDPRGIHPHGHGHGHGDEEAHH